MLVLLLSSVRTWCSCRALVPASLSHRLNVLSTPLVGVVAVIASDGGSGPRCPATAPVGLTPLSAFPAAATAASRHLERMVYIGVARRWSRGHARWCRGDTGEAPYMPENAGGGATVATGDGTCRLPAAASGRSPLPGGWALLSPSPRRDGGTIGGPATQSSASRSAARGHRRPGRGRAADHADRPARDRRQPRRPAGPTRCAPRRRIAHAPRRTALRQAMSTQSVRSHVSRFDVGPSRRQRVADGRAEARYVRERGDGAHGKGIGAERLAHDTQPCQCLQVRMQGRRVRRTDLEHQRLQYGLRRLLTRRRPTRAARKIACSWARC